MSQAKNAPDWKPHDVFVRALLGRGLAVRGMTEDGRYVLEIGGNECTVNLENAARNAVRDDDPGLIEGFVEGLLASAGPLPLWPEARRGIISLAERLHDGMEGVVRDRVSQELVRVLAYTSPGFGQVRWLTESDLASWRVSAEVVLAEAENMSRLLSDSRLTVEDVEGTPLGYFECEAPIKASLIFVPNFREAVSQKMGWPVLVVAPCRDFLYVWPESGKDLIGRMGGVVVREYERSGYPVTTEVLRVSDEGIEAVGRFQAEGANAERGD